MIFHSYLSLAESICLIMVANNIEIWINSSHKWVIEELQAYYINRFKRRLQNQHMANPSYIHICSHWMFKLDVVDENPTRWCLTVMCPNIVYCLSSHPTMTLGSQKPTFDHGTYLLTTLFHNLHETPHNSGSPSEFLFCPTYPIQTYTTGWKRRSSPDSPNGF